MPNRNLTPDELLKANELLTELRSRMSALSGGDQELLFAYRRKIAKELGYDERGTPAHRNRIKAWKMGEQGGKCAICSQPLPEKNAVLDRLEAMGGYTPENTRLIHAECDRANQSLRGFK